MVSIIFALFACITYVISMVIKFNKYVCCILSYGIYLGYNIIVQSIGLDKYSIFRCIDMVGEKTGILVFINIVIVLDVYKRQVSLVLYHVQSVCILR